MTETFIPPGPLKTAVLFLVFNRPDTTAQVFEVIRQAKPPRLYVAADGPRVEREGEPERVSKVREIATSVNWPCEVKTLFRTENLGCKYAVSGAITWFFEQEEQGIILEDDCLPSQSFFWFCEELLIKNSKETRIGMIGGTLMRPAPVNTPGDYFYSRLIQIWGWATWRRTWENYDVNIKKWPAFLAMNGYKNLGISKDIVTYTSKNYQAVYEQKIDTWDYQFSFLLLSSGMLTIVPTRNLVTNIGFGLDGTHTKKMPRGLFVSNKNNISDVKFPLNCPEFMIPDQLYDSRKVKQPNLLRRLLIRPWFSN